MDRCVDMVRGRIVEPHMQRLAGEAQALALQRRVDELGAEVISAEVCHIHSLSSTGGSTVTA